MVDKDLFLHDLAVVAIMKCEGHYLKEWLDYHLAAGVDHFYLYDNESPDNQAEVAKPYVEAGLVDYFSWPGQRMQFPAYVDSHKRFKFQCRYMAIIDGDEFVYPKVTRVDGGHYSIVDVVDEILSHDDKAACLAINWQCFGSNGKDTADYSHGVLERFTRRALKNASINTLCKTIFNPRKVSNLGNPHYVSLFEDFKTINENGGYPQTEGRNRGHNKPVTSEKIVINHYITKSLEEYLNKITRGDAYFSYVTRSKEKFEIHNREANEEFDDSILAYRDERLKIYQPPKPRSNDDLIKALKRNLPLDAPPEFYAGKMETFLTCCEVASYLQTHLADDTQAKFYEELSLDAALKAFVTSPSIADRELFLRELPTLLRLPYAYLQLEHIRELFKDMPDFIDGQGNITSQELELINRPATLMSAKL